jgi:hypothetical protein
MWENRSIYTVLLRKPGNPKEIDHLEDPGVDRRKILRWILRKLDVVGMNCIDLTQDRDRGRVP